MWGVVLQKGSKKVIKRCSDKEEADRLYKYGNIKDEEIEKLGVVSLTKAYPPSKDVKVSEGELYCPYCITYRNFKKGNKVGVKKCVVCGISVKNYYVRKYNKLW